MKIAVVSSGLGHVTRGIETWADDLGTALHRRGVDVTLIKGGGTATRPFEQVVRCARRDSGMAKTINKLLPKAAWRFGCGSPYQIEQTTFALRLIPKLRAERFDIVHLQDYLVADWLEKAHRRGRIPTKVILAHGTEEPAESLAHFEYLQELAPYYLKDRSNGKRFAIPNFVDVERFSPEGERLDLNLPKDAFVILTVSAIKRFHKRVDAVIEEVAQLPAPAHLVVAGAREPETDDVIRLGKQRLGDRVTFLENFDRANMPALYRSADVLLHGALNEMMPIALLEATASGLPVVAHQWPVIEWIVGDGGTCVDAQVSGNLATAVRRYLSPEFRAEKSRNARSRAVKLFSEDVVVHQILQMYKTVLS